MSYNIPAGHVFSNSAMFYFNNYDSTNSVKLSILSWNQTSLQNEMLMLQDFADFKQWKSDFKNRNKLTFNLVGNKRYVGYGYDFTV